MASATGRRCIFIAPSALSDRKGRQAMPAIIMRPDDGETLNVLGMPLRFLCDGPDTGGAWSLMEEEIGPGQGPALHRHDWDEAYYVLDGAVDFHIDGETRRVAKGEFTYLPRNTTHAFKGCEGVVSKVLIFACPAHASDFFHEINREVRELPDDLARLPSIGARHGIEFVSTI